MGTGGATWRPNAPASGRSVALLVAFATLTLASCGGGTAVAHQTLPKTSPSAPQPVVEPPSPSAAPSADPPSPPAAASPAQLALQACVPPLAGAFDLGAEPGPLMVASVFGPGMTPGLKDLIVRQHIGGVLLFGSNFGDSAGLLRWSRELAEAESEAQPSTPLLLMIDQEGGRVRQLADAPPLASALQEGRYGPEAVRARMARSARALRQLGVGIDMAPVADVRTNPQDQVIGDRAYGNRPSVTGPLLEAAVNGLHDGGEAAAVKHFPGLGGAAGDPHHAMPTDYQSAEDWRRTQMPSFLAATTAGADAVMTTALVEPALDPSNTPAVLSRTMTTGLLRQELGFGGVILTDSLSMAGLQPYGSLPELTVKAVAAGADMVLLGSGSTSYQSDAIDAVRQAIAAGQIDARQVRDSAARDLGLRRRWGACSAE